MSEPGAESTDGGGAGAAAAEESMRAYLAEVVIPRSVYRDDLCPSWAREFAEEIGATPWTLDAAAHEVRVAGDVVLDLRLLGEALRRVAIGGAPSLIRSHVRDAFTRAGYERRVRWVRKPGAAT